MERTAIARLTALACALLILLGSAVTVPAAGAWAQPSESAQTLLEQGVTKTQQGEFEPAIEDFTRALEREPDNALLYFSRGIARTLRGNYDAAVRDYDRAIELDPDNASAYFNRANARTQLGNLQGALSDFDAALRQNPEFAAALANRGVARAALGRKDQALADLEKAAELFAQRDRQQQYRQVRERIETLEQGRQ